MMNVTEAIRSHIGNYLWVKALKTHHSKMGRILAPAYTHYLKQAQAAYPGTPDLPSELVGKPEEFAQKGFTSFCTKTTERLAREIMDVVSSEEAQQGEALWNDMARYTGGDLYKKFPQIEELFTTSIGPVLNSIYKANYKIFYGLMIKSTRMADQRMYSQIWHSDGGPGTCINVLFPLCDVDASNGAFESLPWDESVEILSRERAAVRAVGNIPHDERSENLREDLNYFRNAYYEKEVSEKYADRVTQFCGKAGTVVAFRNNILHRGGFVQPDRTRYAIIFHVFPSINQVPLERYRTQGITKVTGMPSSPDFDD